MKYAALIAIAAAVSAAPASISDTWYTLTPTGTFNSSVGAITSITGSYALSLRTVSASVSEGISLDKRDVITQISDGQIQADTKTEESTSKTTAAAESVINQISDGQIQEQTTTTKTTAAAETTTASVVNQIGDGQIQEQTTTTSKATTASVVNQIGDGQIQQQTTTTSKATTASVVNQIGDGQIQQQTTSTKTTAAAESVINQISDGQIQEQTTSTSSKTTATVAAQISDGQIQQSVAAESVTASTSASSSTSSSEYTFEETCVTSDSLVIKLLDGELRDGKGRVGAIVANRQFQFDGPPPQAGTIYAAGWSFVPADVAGLGETESDTTDSGYKLALGDQTTFYKCLSGDFYNLYDESIGSQCSAVEIFVLKAETC